MIVPLAEAQPNDALCDCGVHGSRGYRSTSLYAACPGVSGIEVVPDGGRLSIALQKIAEGTIVVADTIAVDPEPKVEKDGQSRIIVLPSA